MRQILVFGVDSQLAKFYFHAHRTGHTTNHIYRTKQVACYSTVNDGLPALIALAKKLCMQHEVVEHLKPYRQLKRHIQYSYQPGERFTRKDLTLATSLSPSRLSRALAHLIQCGYLEGHGTTRDRCYTRTVPTKEKPDNGPAC
jgi:hypothetical protein